MTRSIVFRGRKIQVAVGAVQLATGETVQYDIVVHPGAVAILPMLDEEHVCLVHNQRPVVGETLWEIPAGLLEPGERPEHAAVRELAEETGYRAGRWQKLNAFIPSPGVLSEVTHLFLARDLAPGPQQLEKGEQLEPHTIAWSKALQWALDGTIRDAKTLIAILLWEKLRAKKGC